MITKKADETDKTNSSSAIYFIHICDGQPSKIMPNHLNKIKPLTFQFKFSNGFMFRFP